MRRDVAEMKMGRGPTRVVEIPVISRFVVVREFAMQEAAEGRTGAAWSARVRVAGTIV